MLLALGPCVTFFFFNDTATTEIYTFPYTTLFRSRRRASRTRAAARRRRRCPSHAGSAWSAPGGSRDRKSTRLNSSHITISYAVFCLKKKKKNNRILIYKTKKKKKQI